MRVRLNHHRWPRLAAVPVTSVIQVAIANPGIVDAKEQSAMFVRLLNHMEAMPELDDLGVARLAIPRDAALEACTKVEAFAVVRVLVTLITYEPATVRAVEALTFFADIIGDLMAGLPTHTKDLNEAVDQFVRGIIGGKLSASMYGRPTLARRTAQPWRACVWGGRWRADHLAGAGAAAVGGARHAKFLTGRDLSWRMGRMMGREHHHEIIANLRRSALAANFGQGTVSRC